MTDMHGQFVWYELMTTDIDKAETFYTNVVGWAAQDAGMPDGSYRVLTAAGARAAGLTGQPDHLRQANVPPTWIGYIAVHDVDAAAARVTELGGAVHRGPDDIPAVGRFAVVSDPHGAVFSLFRAASTYDSPPSVGPTSPGHIGWKELAAGDLDGDFVFYEALFGWTKGDAMDMGPMGPYQMFGLNEMMMGGMMKMPSAEGRPHWLYYFNVEAIDAAVSRIGTAGGHVVHGPVEVPGGSWIVQGVDSQGGMFALVAPKR